MLPPTLRVVYKQAPGNRWIASCLENPVAAVGTSIENATQNLRKALSDYFDDPALGRTAVIQGRIKHADR